MTAEEVNGWISDPDSENDEEAPPPWAHVDGPESVPEDEEDME